MEFIWSIPRAWPPGESPRAPCPRLKGREGPTGLLIPPPYPPSLPSWTVCSLLNWQCCFISLPFTLAVSSAWKASPGLIHLDWYSSTHSSVTSSGTIVVAPEKVTLPSVLTPTRPFWTLHPIHYGFTVLGDCRQGSDARKECSKVSVV